MIQGVHEHECNNKDVHTVYTKTQLCPSSRALEEGVWDSNFKAFYRPGIQDSNFKQGEIQDSKLVNQFWRKGFHPKH